MLRWISMLGGLLIMMGHQARSEALFYVGRWTYSGDHKPSPAGPGGEVVGESTAQMVLGGWFLQERFSEKAPSGPMSGLEIWGYDPVKKNYPYTVYMDDGSSFSGTLRVNGNTWSWEGKIAVAGTQYQLRGKEILSEDLMSIANTAEASADGQTWAPLWEEKFTKVKPASKK